MSHDDDQAVEEELEGETSSVGQELKSARQALSLTIEQVSSDLRIEPQYLTAIEENDFDSFSAPVFAKGYLKQYAARVGLNPDGVLTRYYRQVGTQEIPKLRTPTLEYASDQQQARWLIAGSIVTLILAGLMIWRFSVPDPEPPAVEESVEDVVEVVPAEPQPVSGGLAPPVVAEPEEPETPVAPAPVEEAEPMLEVEIVFAEDCWTEVIDSRGDRLFYGLGSAGARTRFTASPPLSFFLGNANGVELYVDERPYAIPGESRQGNLARFVIVESGA